MIIGDFNTGAVTKRRLVEALRVEVGLIDKGAADRGASMTKKVDCRNRSWDSLYLIL
jgi:hypothetical protein